MMRAASPRHQTWPKMPPFGVADAIIGPHADSADRFYVWLASHNVGSTFWQIAVLRELLVPPTDDLAFEAIGEMLR